MVTQQQTQRNQRRRRADFDKGPEEERKRRISSRTMACFRGNREEFYGEVLLLDNRKLTLTVEQGIKRSSKAVSILQLVFVELGVVEVEFFGLKFCDNWQQTLWLDPSKTLSQHKELAGPPYIFYFGVKFYIEDPSKLNEETTRRQFYLQLCQDVRRGRLPCSGHLRAQLCALMLQADRGNQSEDNTSDAEETQEVQLIRKTLSGVPRSEAQRHFLSVCSSLQMYGVSLFAAYGENHTEYFLGPTPVGVVIFKNKELVGKYLWQRIIKLHYKDEKFELRVSGRNGSATSFFFQTSDCRSCKHLWKCCVEHHTFFRMSEINLLTHKLNHNSFTCSKTPSLRLLKNGIDNKTASADVCVRATRQANHKPSCSSELITKHSALPAVQRGSEGRAKPDHAKPSAPWENNTNIGLFNPKFCPNTNKDEQVPGRPQRRSRSLDGDRPIREQRRSRSHSRGNTSSGSESEKMSSNSERCRRRPPKCRHSDHGPDTTSCHHRRRHTQSHSPDNQIWKHIQKELVEPPSLIDRQMEDIPYKEVRVLGEPVRMRRSRWTRRHQRWVSASDLRCTELLPPLPVTTAADTSCRFPTSKHS
uniref:band 4.1-like protein 4 isoform X3 n=1 Tax=Maylandia zebra TaxID=106582 RepID=UPI00064629B5|nr:band 4.1-like protein 4 isoform X3 [Maylandia zebra]